MCEKSSRNRRSVLKALGGGLSLAAIGGIGQVGASSDGGLRQIVTAGYEASREANQQAATTAQDIRESGVPGAEDAARNHQVDAVTGMGDIACRRWRCICDPTFALRIQ